MPHLHFLEFQRLGLINPLQQIARKEASITSGTPLHHATSEHSRVPLRGNGFQSISLWGVSARGSLLLQSCSPSTRLRASWSAQRILVSPAGRRTLLIKDSLTSLALLAISPSGHIRVARSQQQIKNSNLREGVASAILYSHTPPSRSSLCVSGSLRENLFFNPVDPLNPVHNKSGITALSPHPINGPIPLSCI